MSLVTLCLEENWQHSLYFSKWLVYVNLQNHSFFKHLNRLIWINLNMYKLYNCKYMLILLMLLLVLIRNRSRPGWHTVHKEFISSIILVEPIYLPFPRKKNSTFKKNILRIGNSKSRYLFNLPLFSLFPSLPVTATFLLKQILRVLVGAPLISFFTAQPGNN